MTFDTEFTLIAEGGTQTPIKDMPNLVSVPVERNDLTYNLYYLVLNEGIGEQPIKVDSAFVSYKGSLLDNTVFDAAETPVWFKLEEVIPGWGEIVTKFKGGTSTINGNGTVTYSDYGAGVMFLPSSFGYYSASVGLISSYSQLIFNFKLYNQRHRDQDFDKILSMDEYYDTDGITLLDTDADGTPNYLDIDDDNDGILTKEEIKFTYVENGITKKGYYPFNGAATDDPSTPYDETKGIPDCLGDFITPTRVRKHLILCE